MAALDYGMALARGLVAPQKELQEEIKKLAGTAFKSDDWWNKQLDRQIKEGISNPRKEYLKEVYHGMHGGATTAWMPVKTAGVDLNNPRKTMPNARYENGAPITRLNTNVIEQKDLTTGQLKAIQTQAEQSADKIKRDARLAKSKTKRGARGSGGLLGKSTQQDKGLSAKLPELGSMGLGIEKTYLG
ncbi:hypothetical protein N9268_02460 [Akkermansiaceae bacterium]|nr:hypothetical protein [Akkermansiaceae bacterium]